ncbi:ribonuclease Y [Patescibacteria group bacterium]|nr:ribonuclease Y [Patescibacteria group bacterium]MBU1256118.1 ribonuclease Y [Patescibacteria group bacterium]MBU1457206.1 ribonuclease Y [Patescibacteria group bacterium]
MPLLKKKTQDLQSKAREIILEAKDEAINIKNQALAEMVKLDKKAQDLSKKEIDLKAKAESLTEDKKQYKKKQEELTKKLEKLSSLTSSEAKTELLEQIKKSGRADIARTIKEAEEEATFKAEDAAKEILVEAIRAGATDYVSEYTVSTIKIENEETKSRVIGKEGRNIRAFEKITGVDLIMDETPGEIKISSFNSTRREIAKIALLRLIKDGRIQPSRIEEYVEKAKADLEKVLFQEGRRLCQSINLFNVPRELISILGRFKFRTSYGQNMIAHTLEVVRIGTKLAQEIGANLETIKLGCLFHDIGKVLEGDGSHVELGVKLLKQHNLPKAVIDAVEQHHEDVPFSSTESILVYIADAISGARSGARRENIEEYIERIEQLEKIAMDNPEVKEAFAIQAGREIRVIVHPDKITDDGLVILATSIRDQIRDNLTYPGTVKVNVIREVRVSEIAK